MFIIQISTVVLRWKVTHTWRQKLVNFGACFIHFLIESELSGFDESRTELKARSTRHFISRQFEAKFFRPFSKLSHRLSKIFLLNIFFSCDASLLDKFRPTDSNKTVDIRTSLASFNVSRGLQKSSIDFETVSRVFWYVDVMRDKDWRIFSSRGPSSSWISIVESFGAKSEKSTYFKTLGVR